LNFLLIGTLIYQLPHPLQTHQNGLTAKIHSDESEIDVVVVAKIRSDTLDWILTNSLFLTDKRLLFTERIATILR